MFTGSGEIVLLKQAVLEAKWLQVWRASEYFANQLITEIFSQSVSFASHNAN